MKVRRLFCSNCKRAIRPIWCQGKTIWFHIWVAGGTYTYEETLDVYRVRKIASCIVPKPAWGTHEG